MEAVSPTRTERRLRQHLLKSQMYRCDDPSQARRLHCNLPPVERGFLLLLPPPKMRCLSSGIHSASSRVRLPKRRLSLRSILRKTKTFSGVNLPINCLAPPEGRQEKIAAEIVDANGLPRTKKGDDIFQKVPMVYKNLVPF